MYPIQQLSLVSKPKHPNFFDSQITIENNMLHLHQLSSSLHPKIKNPDPLPILSRIDGLPIPPAASRRGLIPNKALLIVPWGIAMMGNMAMGKGNQMRIF